MWPCYNELYHHGVMGMHWGVRRSSPRASSISTLLTPTFLSSQPPTKEKHMWKP